MGVNLGLIVKLVFFDDLDGGFAYVTGIDGKLVVPKALHQRIKTIPNAASKIEQLIGLAVILFGARFDQIMELIPNIVSVFVEVVLVVFVKDVPVQSLIVLQLRHRFIIDRLAIFVYNRLCIARHILIPLIILHVSIYDTRLLFLSCFELMFFGTTILLLPLVYIILIFKRLFTLFYLWPVFFAVLGE